MINVSVKNRKNLLTSLTVEKIITNEENRTRQLSIVEARQRNETYRKYYNLYSYCGKPYNQFTPNNGIQIFFYEWSDLTQVPKKFYKKEDFLKFIEKSNIVLDEDAQKRVESAQYGIFCSCLKDKNIAVVAYTFCALINEWGTKSYMSSTPSSSTTMPSNGHSKMQEILARDNIDFDFFEFSDLNRTPLHFSSWKTLMEFCDKYGMKISSHNEKRLKALNKKRHYGCCLTGYNLISARDSTEKLATALEEVKNKSTKFEIRRDLND